MVKKFSLPGFYSMFNVILDFLKYRQKYPEYFYEDRIIDSLYDVPPNTIWGGGREPYRPLRPVEMDQVVNTFSQLFPDLELRYVFTNNLITKEIALDYKSNQIVKRYIRPQDSVIINHPILIKHFQEHYPTIKLIYSTTINAKNINQVNDFTKNHLYVMNYAYNNDDNYISQLIYKNNIEVLCGESCDTDCPQRAKHYESISRQFLGLPPLEINCRYCTPEYYFDLEDVLTRKHAVTNQRIDELSSQGINYFKLAGRGLIVPCLLEILLYYLVKPEYINRARAYFVSLWW